jgi:hypothetical protein
MMEISIDAMQQNDKSKKVMERFVGAMQQHDKSKGSSLRHPDFFKTSFLLMPELLNMSPLYCLAWHSDLWKMSLLNAPTILNPLHLNPHLGDENF